MPRAPAEHVVALGASAGGLEPLIDFFRACPTGHGLAFIVVQHLAHAQHSALPALLQQHTKMPVCEAHDGAPLRADEVHVIAPASRLTVAGGRLQVAPLQPGDSALALIDDLFCSLAQAWGPAAVAVVLSGMGSDGSAGLRAVVDHGGLGLVQRPENAQFDSMPRQALAACAGVASDLSARLPQRILAALALPAAAAPAAAPPEPADGSDDAAALAQVLAQVCLSTGHDFSLYKTTTLRRRIERRMALQGSRSMAAYQRLLQANPQEAELLFKELLIGVTAFFRDAPVWQALAERLLPGLLAAAAARPEPRLRAWVLGCSTGEEAYSLAMLLLEAQAATPALQGLALQIFATDLNADAIQVARRGVYPAAIAETLSPQRLARFFIAEGGGWRVCKALREVVLFARHDVVSDAPFTRLDLLSCRNLLIYFKAELQHRLLPLIHYVLQPGGVLMLGNAETVGRFEHLLQPLDAKLRLYQRCDVARAEAAMIFPTRAAAMSTPPLPPSSEATPPAPPSVSLQAQADRLMLDEFSPPAVLVNAEGDILYISGRTGRYLEPAAGRANWNVHAMAREGLRSGLAGALRQALQSGQSAEAEGLALNSDGLALVLDLLVRPVRLAGQGPLLLVLFREQVDAGPRRPRGRSRGADPALQGAREEAQALREEMRSSQEELQSANEELQSTNEELQSTNEELTTSKEEMQAMNEELRTVNTELMARLQDLALAQSDLKNLLNSTQIATLFLDADLNVRRFTEQARKVINLRDGDVGRPLSDLTTPLDYPTLRTDIAQVQQTLAASEKAVLSADGCWYAVRVMPYRTQDNVIDGSVITFVDITAAKALEARLRLTTGGPAAP